MNTTNNTPGPLEQTILDILWTQGPSTAKAVREVIAKDRDLAYSTVLTVLRRMEAKGMLTRKKVSRSHVYEPAVDRAAFKKATVKDLLVRLFGGSPTELMAHLVEEQKITSRELSKIEKLLARRKKR